MYTKGNISVPVSIIIAGLIIGGAIIFTNSNSGSNNQHNAPVVDGTPGVEERDATEFFVEISKDDHIRGDKNAKVKLVEYSDIDCPFCGRIHETLTELVNENDDVAWVYRHLPLAQLHPHAELAAAATECIADQDEDSFWTYLDSLFVNGERSSTRDILVATAGNISGIDIEEFTSCLDDGKFTDRVNTQKIDATNLGFNGTPAVVIVGPNGELIPISGAQPKPVFEQAITQLLAS